ncbi:hypothetical protein [Komagataeibacter swingsii]|nr:hypothetical protein [Komagataeibacter swingsii]
MEEKFLGAAFCKSGIFRSFFDQKLHQKLLYDLPLVTGAGPDFRAQSAT